MAEEVNVPKVGGVNKGVLMVIGGGAAAYVAYRWYKAKSGASSAAATPADTGSATATGFDTTGTGYDSSNMYGGPGSQLYGLGYYNSQQPTLTDYGFTGQTDSQWTQYAAQQLSQDGTWAFTDVVTALGLYLNSQALTTTQTQIVQAAIAVAGYPPSGSRPIVTGGNTQLVVAPTGLQVTGHTSSSVSLSWSSVSGASSYQVYENGQSVGNASGTTYTATGLQPSTTYSFTVAGVDSSHTPGPQSTAVSGKTDAAAAPIPGKPGNFHAWDVTNHGFTLSWEAVAGADHYNLYLGNSVLAKDGGTWHPFTTDKPRTKYGPYYLTAVNADGKEGPKVGPVYATTTR